MKRIMLDTNIYGELILDNEFIKFKQAIRNKFVVHGFNLIRNELRDVPKKIKLEGKNLRISLLHIYDELTRKSYILTPEIRELARNYYKAYRQLGGSKGHDVMLDDLSIVACATIYQIDLVVSEDNKSMLTENALKAYDLINSLQKKRTPSFIGYLEFKRWLSE